MRPFITALAMALALPASALAVPANDVIRAQAPHSSLAVQPPATAATAAADLRAPDQQDGATLPKRLPTPGTDVAAPDQQAPLGPVAHQSAPRAAGHTAAEGFDWADAAIGAGGLALLTIVAAFGVLGAQRRRGSRQVASIG
jgi:hypothetical protein